MPRFQFIAVLFSLTACMQSTVNPTPSPIQGATVDDAIRAQIECGRRNISQIDDGVSDAGTVALALALSCNGEYNAATEAVAYGLDNDVQRRMLHERRAERENRIEAFLPTVMQYRQIIKAE